MGVPLHWLPQGVHNGTEHLPITDEKQGGERKGGGCPGKAQHRKNRNSVSSCAPKTSLLLVKSFGVPSWPPSKLAKNNNYEFFRSPEEMITRKDSSLQLYRNRALLLDL